MKDKIVFLSNQCSWVNEYIQEFIRLLEVDYAVSWFHEVSDAISNSIVFVLSFSTILPRVFLDSNKHVLVVHESNLPEGRGWSPLSWKILEGKNVIPISLFEAGEGIDSGAIYLQDEIIFTGDELVGELRQKQADSSLALCRRFLEDYKSVIAGAKPQVGDPTFYKKRTPNDSEIDVNKSIASQFDLLRIVDNEKYPAFFNYRNKKYLLKIYDDESDIPHQRTENP